jgi:FAD/FMN-containing dehydrogenase
VYEALDGTGLNVVGGRVSGVGVAGFTLGGGYSWKTNQYGLTIDNIESFELVRPDGTIQTVTSQDEDLWFALRGGFNNFVCQFTIGLLFTS